MPRKLSVSTAVAAVSVWDWDGMVDEAGLVKLRGSRRARDWSFCVLVKKSTGARLRFACVIPNLGRSTPNADGGGKSSGTGDSGAEQVRQLGGRDRVGRRRGYRGSGGASQGRRSGSSPLSLGDARRAVYSSRNCLLATSKKCEAKGRRETAALLEMELRAASQVGNALARTSSSINDTFDTLMPLNPPRPHLFYPEEPRRCHPKRSHRRAAP